MKHIRKGVLIIDVLVLIIIINAKSSFLEQEYFGVQTLKIIVYVFAVLNLIGLIPLFSSIKNSKNGN